MNERKDDESGTGHPLPVSEEARHDRLPEHLEREKGLGDDPPGRAQPADEAVDPEGEPYEVSDAVKEL